MAAMFTAKDLEVYKDSLKEKKSNTAEKPAKTPPSISTKVSKLPLKLNNEEPNKDRKPLSVVHRASNTIKDPHKPPSPLPIGSSKQADQSRKTKETPPKSPPPGKLHATEANTPFKASEYRGEPLKSPREGFSSKTSIKSDDNKATGMRKPSTHASPVYQKSPSLSGAKASPAIDVNASLCSECTRSASEGAVCFIGNDGRVSACTSRSAVRLCKNLNCAANNPEYVAAMANAPKKYLISKRHQLKAQFAPKSKTSRPKSPNVHQRDAAENDGMCRPQDAVSPSNEELSPKNVDESANDRGFAGADADLSLLEGNLGSFDEDMSVVDRNVCFDNDELVLKSDVATILQDFAGDEHTDFSFHDGEAADPQSPTFLAVESPKDLIDTHSAGENLHEDAESLAIDTFEEPYDEDFDGSPMHRETKAEELSISYGDLMPNEEVEADDQLNNVAEPIQMGNDDLTVTATENIIEPLPAMVENAGEDNQTGDTSLTTDVLPTIETINQDTENNQESNLLPSTTVKQVIDDNCEDEIMSMLDSKQVLGDNNNGCSVSIEAGEVVNGEMNGDLITLDDNCLDKIMPMLDSKLVVDDNNNGCSMSIDAGEVVNDVMNGELITLDDTHIAQENQKGSETDGGLELKGDLPLADEQQDIHTPSDDDCSGVTTSPNDKEVEGIDVGITSPHGAEDEQSSDDITSSHDITSPHDSGDVEDEDQSDEDGSEDDEPDAMIRDTFTAEGNTHIDAQNGIEAASTERVSNSQDGGDVSNSSARRQRRRRVLRVEEDVSPETVILRKQQMKERKQKEEWMPNHAIEGVVHKLAPTGEARVKVLVEAFESIISNTDVDIIDTHNTRQEKRAMA